MSFSLNSDGIIVSKPYGDGPLPQWKAEGFKTPGRYQQSLRMRAYWASKKGDARRVGKPEEKAEASGD